MPQNNVVTLKLNKEFKRAYYRGSYRADPLLVTYLVKTHLGQIRYGITTGKKVGNAVARNRARRIIRVAFANVCKERGWIAAERVPGYDFVFVAREKTALSNSNELTRVVSGQIAKLLNAPDRRK